ncbi:hypothetical protein TRIATDRAFT_299522 [Trichoderma atroviride IMI 206040]|uniref:Stress response RCI peptide n=1 Tax=Hypocrea atroviridis (strain ATCC 20476 / IMI 206040) TaxID=452589 RepID=G9NTG2_HYPAI|nr:uncharacterized protein TRIATDRAFT_299522 [Trichoderma atroviride IMI 206040]EHK46004.1 hypothetical protein TRIATDRAFT_299522 [Trichoderma atroviride IMI 206040]
MCSTDMFLGILAILFPPLPVWVKRGLCGADSLINICLCILGFIPGLLHAWYIIAKYPEPAYEYEAIPNDREGGRVTYVYVQPHGPHFQPPKPQGSSNQMNYGTASNQNSSPQPQPQQQGVAGSGEGSSNPENQGVPPSYAEVVAGDHKVQTQD